MLTKIVGLGLFVLALGFPSFTAVAANQSRTIEEIKLVFWERGYKIPPDEVLEEVQAADRASAHGLSEAALIAVGRMAGLRIGQPLKTQRGCFTCDMRVLTINGYVEFRDLREGDIVLSWDEKLETLVHNQIQKIHSHEDQPYGTLRTAAALKPIKVTPTHRFYLPERGEYISIGEVGASEKLLGLIDSSSCQYHLKSRGTFVPNTRGNVFNLTLSREPHNYFVEDVLVHNIKLGI